MTQGEILSAEDRAELVEIIQRCTAGMSDRQKLQLATNWLWMGHELIRVAKLVQPEKHQLLLQI